MGKLAPTGIELATDLLTGSLSAAGASASIALYGRFNLTLSGTFSATVQLQRSFDGGTTWVERTIDTTGAAASFTAPVSLSLFEPERGVIYQLDVTAYTSGTVNFRLSTTSPAASAWGIA